MAGTISNCILCTALPIPMSINQSTVDDLHTDHDEGVVGGGWSRSAEHWRQEWAWPVANVQPIVNSRLIVV